MNESGTSQKKEKKNRSQRNKTNSNLTRDGSVSYVPPLIISWKQSFYTGRNGGKCIVELTRRRTRTIGGRDRVVASFERRRGRVAEERARVERCANKARARQNAT